MQQARYWICTIPRDDWTPCLPEGAAWCCGQPELGESGYRHWQLIVSFASKKTMAQVKRTLCSTAHVEATRSSAAETYCRKEESRDGEPFEFGTKVLNRNSARDWDLIRDAAKKNDLDSVPSDLFIRYYSSLRRIAADFAAPEAILRSISVFWGPTGTGKSRRAWEEATLLGGPVYAKDPRSKFWCGYRGEANVIIDEFRGGIDVSHLLRWFDRYPVRVETKGASAPLVGSKIWITSNLHPASWFPELDPVTYSALERRLEIIKID